MVSICIDLDKDNQNDILCMTVVFDQSYHLTNAITETSYTTFVILYFWFANDIFEMKLINPRNCVQISK